jgi:hypothetical protein
MQMRRTVMAAALIAVTMTGLAAALAVPAADAATAPIALGADTTHAPGNTTQGKNSVLAVESEIGRQLSFTRDYLLWDSAFPTAFETWLGARGTTPMISVKSKLTNGTVVPWASVAAAQPGSALYAQIVSWADRMRDFGYPLYFTYNHEPEAAGNAGYGTTADYIAAWRHIHDIVVAEGATNVHFMWIMTDYAFKVPTSDARYAWKWYPGDAYVDGIAADAYNWSNCRYANGQWQSLATAISGFMTFGAQHPSEPMWLTEFGSTEDPAIAGRKAGWLSAAQTMLQQPAYSQIVGVAYFNEPQAAMPNCTWPIESSTSATAAYATMAQQPYFQGPVTFPSSSPPPVDPPPGSPAFAGASSTTANAATETVRVPTTAAAGSGLVLVATSSTAQVPTAPAGWTLVTSATSTTMASAVYERVATSADAGNSVTVNFGVLTKGSVELLAYAGTDRSAPVATATVRSVDNATSVSTPAAAGAAAGSTVVSYWAVRSSADQAIAPPAAVTVRSSETSTGGGRITSLSADGTDAGSQMARMTPAAPHAQAWTIVLAPVAA